MYLLDTDILSSLVKPAPPTDLLDHLATLGKHDLYTSSINLGELLYGLLRLRKGAAYFRRLERLRERITVVSFDSRCADVYAQLRVDLERKGVPLPDLDLMIASVALENGLTLVTGNERHFLRIPELNVENWLRAS